MSELFRAITERLTAVFAANAALEIETELITAHIQRKASLLRLAVQCEEEGFGGLSEELRKYAESMNPRQPTASILPTTCEAQVALAGSMQPLSDQQGGNDLLHQVVTAQTRDEEGKQTPTARKKPR